VVCETKVTHKRSKKSIETRKNGEVRLCNIKKLGSFCYTSSESSKSSFESSRLYSFARYSNSKTQGMSTSTTQQKTQRVYTDKFNLVRITHNLSLPLPQRETLNILLQKITHRGLSGALLHIRIILYPHPLDDILGDTGVGAEAV